MGEKTNHPGLSYQEPGDYLEGFEPSLAKKILEEDLKYRVSPVTTTSKDWRDAFKLDADLVLSSISYTAERAEEGYIFAGPYLQTPLGAVSRNKQWTKDQITNLRGMNVCYVDGTIAGEVVKQMHGNDSKISTLKKESDQECLKAVKDSEKNMFISDGAILYGWLSRENKKPGQGEPLFKYYSEENLPANGKETQKYVIAMEKDQQSLCLAIDQALEAKLKYHRMELAHEFEDFMQTKLPLDDIKKIFIPKKVDWDLCKPSSSQG